MICQKKTESNWTPCRLIRSSSHQMENNLVMRQGMLFSLMMKRLPSEFLYTGMSIKTPKGDYTTEIKIYSIHLHFCFWVLFLCKEDNNIGKIYCVV